MASLKREEEQDKGRDGKGGDRRKTVSDRQ